MKTILYVVAGALTLFGQIILCETTDWGIAYLNAHPGIKPIPLVVGLASSLFFTLTITPISNATMGIVISSPDGKHALNPFWIWLGICLIITFGINLLME